MNLQEHIRKVLREELNESKNSNRLKILNDLVEPFSKDIGVCRIETWYDDIDDMYLVYLVFGTKELNDWFTSRNLSTDAKFTYIKKKQKEVRDTIKSFFPIENIHVGSYGRPHCGVESLNESVPSQVRRRHGEFDRIFKHYRDSFINYPYKSFNSFWNTLLEVSLETLYHAWFSKTVSDDDWEESAEYIENYLIEKYKEETKQMWNDRDSDSINESEGKKGKYIGVLEDLTEYFKNEDCVCDIQVEHKPEEFRDSYLITVVLGNRDLDNKFNGISWQISEYRTKLKRKITKEILEFLPIPFYIEFRQTPKCSDYKNLQESEHKKSNLLKAIEEDGLLNFIKMTGLSLPQIYTKTGELPREVFDRFIKEFINKEGYHQSNGAVQLGYEIELQTHVYVDHFYLEGDRVTLEIKGYNNHGEQTDGYIESMSNLTDEEVFTIVEYIILWGLENLHYEI